MTLQKVSNNACRTWMKINNAPKVVDVDVDVDGGGDVKVDDVRCIWEDFAFEGCELESVIRSVSLTVKCCVVERGGVFSG